MSPFDIPLQTLGKAQLLQISEGAERSIYACDDYPALVFKRQKPWQERQLKSWDLKSFLLRNLPGFHTYNVSVEHKTYLRACLSGPLDLAALPIARIFGFVPSELGPLQICEKISLDGHSPGPTLNALGRKGVLADEDIAALSLFAQRLLQSQVPTHDVNGANIVKGADGNGGVRFVLVDGLGDVNLIPVRRYSARVRRTRLVKRFDRFTKFGLVFDRQQFTFARAT